MEKLEQKLREIKSQNRLSLMTHVVIGYPSLEDTVRLVKLMEECGVDIVELQIPFSDPLADGPTIMKACEESLRRGTKVKNAFEVVRVLSQNVSIPLLFMAYYNTVFKYQPFHPHPNPLPSRERENKDEGTKEFCRDAKDVGMSGLIVPDVPLDEEENEHFIALCCEFNLADIRVVSPASTQERLRKNAEVATGFVYCTARQGITGARKSLDPKISKYLEEVRSLFTSPIAVGFGISKREHVKALEGYADIAVVGSALIDIINSSKNYQKNVQLFLQKLRS